MQQLLHRLSEPGLALDALYPPCADPDVLKALLQCPLEFRLPAGGEEAGKLCCLLVGGELVTRNREARSIISILLYILFWGSGVA